LELCALELDATEPLEFCAAELVMAELLEGCSLELDVSVTELAATELLDSVTLELDVDFASELPGLTAAELEDNLTGLSALLELEISKPSGSEGSTEAFSLSKASFHSSSYSST
jgi:hypothetical protein